MRVCFDVGSRRFRVNYQDLMQVDCALMIVPDSQRSASFYFYFFVLFLLVKFRLISPFRFRPKPCAEYRLLLLGFPSSQVPYMRFPFIIHSLVREILCVIWTSITVYIILVILLNKTCNSQRLVTVVPFTFVFSSSSWVLVCLSLWEKKFLLCLFVLRWVWAGCTKEGKRARGKAAEQIESVIKWDFR